MIRFETKIIIAISFFLAVGLSVLNGINITFLKFLIREKLNTEIMLYSKACKENENCKLPPYFSFSTTIDKNFKPVAKINKGFLTVDVNYVNSELRRIATVVFLWEAIILVVLTIILSKVMNHYIRKEKNIKEFLRLLLLIFTHKLGNFLAVQRLNLDMVERSCGTSKALERLKQGYKLLEDDFYFVLNNVKEMGVEGHLETVNLKDVFQKLIYQFSPLLKNKRLSLKLNDAPVRMRRKDAENMAYFLLENAVKYSRSSIRVRTGKVGSTVYLSVLNDISDYREKGKGVGLELVEFLVRRYKGKLKVKFNSKFFVSVGFK